MANKVKDVMRFTHDGVTRELPVRHFDNQAQADKWKKQSQARADRAAEKRRVAAQARSKNAYLEHRKAEARLYNGK